MDPSKQCRCLASAPRSPLAARKRYLWLLLLVASACSKPLCGTLVDQLGEVIIPEDTRVYIRPIDDGKKTAGFWVPVNRRGQFEVETSLDEGFYFVETLIPGYEASSLRFHYTSPQVLTVQIEKKNQTVNKQVLNPKKHDSKSAKLDLPKIPPDLLPQESSDHAKPHPQ